MTRLIAALLILATAGCGGGSTAPIACVLCGTWYSRYDANGALIAHESNRSLILKADSSFNEIVGAPPGGLGKWAVELNHLILYNDLGSQTGVVEADSITFAANGFGPRRVYAR